MIHGASRRPGDVNECSDSGNHVRGCRKCFPNCAPVISRRPPPLPRKDIASPEMPEMPEMPREGQELSVKRQDLSGMAVAFAVQCDPTAYHAEAVAPARSYAAILSSCASVRPMSSRPLSRQWRRKDST